MKTKLLRVVDGREWIIPCALFFIFIAVTLPGIRWGLPALWHPDELVWRVDKALAGELIFNETEPDYNYPSLPKYAMYGIGKIVYGLGYSHSTFIAAARVLSVLIGAFVCVLVFFLARAVGAKVFASLLAGLFYLASPVVSSNARLAHNDLYLLLFSTLCVYASIKYQQTKTRLWIYGSFLAVGMAASSKYNGASLLCIPLFVFVIMNWRDLWKDWLRSLETLFIGGVLVFGGYAIGTPKALFWMAYYFKRAIPAAQRFAVYGKNYDVPIGLFGQWDVFKEAVGPFMYYLFILGFVWIAAKLILWKFGKLKLEGDRASLILILVAALVVFDLPFLVSVNYVPRFFIPFVPFLSVLAALFVSDLHELFRAKKWERVWVAAAFALFLGTFYSLLQLASVALLFLNDARIPAGNYIAQLPGANKIIEYTLYPPIVNKAQFEKARNYPVYFVKYPGEVAPTGGKIDYNQGERGLIDRDVDYLVIDTITYTRFYDDAICATNPVECDFFKKLLNGEIASFRLLKEFSYALPPYLPAVSVFAVNPGIRIYERTP